MAKFYVNVFMSFDVNLYLNTKIFAEKCVCVCERERERERDKRLCKTHTEETYLSEYYRWSPCQNFPGVSGCLNVLSETIYLFSLKTHLKRLKHFPF